MRQATFAALAVALTLALAKAIAWWLSGSVSLLAGLTEKQQKKKNTPNKKKKKQKNT